MTRDIKPSTARVAETNPAVVERYKDMRGVVMALPEADKTIAEILITCELALLGHEVPFRFHALRLFQMGVSRERLEGFILACLGVTMVLPDVARTLDWIAVAHADHLATPAA